jgi:hypothetical protein
MKNLLYTLFFTLAFTFAYANHILGGYWEYRVQDVKQNRFTIAGTFNLLRSSKIDNAANFETEIQIGIYLKKNNIWTFFTSNQISLNKISDRIKNTPVVCSDANFELEKGVYNFTFDLPKQDGDYMFVYLRCCRNEDAVNLNNPINAGSAIHLISNKIRSRKNTI